MSSLAQQENKGKLFSLNMVWNIYSLFLNHLPLIYLGTEPEVEVQGAEESALSSDEFLPNEGESEWEDTEESEIDEDDKDDKPSKRCKKPKLGCADIIGVRQVTASSNSHLTTTTSKHRAQER